MKSFLQGVVHFWQIAVFRKELPEEGFLTKPYCAGFLTGCGLMFATGAALAAGVGLAYFHWRA